MNPIRGRDWSLQLFSMNQEFPVGVSHKLASITSLPFVHTARRYYRLSVLVRSSDCCLGGNSFLSWRREDDQTVALRGSKSRNKVSVGEPAEGSLQCYYFCVNCGFNLARRPLFSLCPWWRVRHSALRRAQGFRSCLSEGELLGLRHSHAPSV